MWKYRSLFHIYPKMLMNCEIFGFHIGAVEMFVLLGYFAASLNEECPTFRYTLTGGSSRVECPT
jgi:hypothetical protein